MAARCSRSVGVHLVLDIDETILNPFDKWMEEVNKHFGWTVSSEDVADVGGWDRYLGAHPRYADFVAFATSLREDPEFNTGLAEVEGACRAVEEILRLPGLCFQGYLTTRPQSLAELTLAEVTMAGFPGGEVWARPVDVDRAATATWKVSQLERIRRRVTGVLIMVDDSLELGLALQSRNEAGHAPIVAVVFEGPLTKGIVAREGVVSSPSSHFYVGNWHTVVAVVAQYCAGPVRD